MMMNTDESEPVGSGSGQEAGKAPDPSTGSGQGPSTGSGQAPAAPAPLPTRFTMGELIHMQQFGVLPEQVQRLLFTCFHLQGVIMGTNKSLQQMAGQHKLMMDALGCLAKLNGGRLAVGLNVKKTISPKAQFDFTYDKRLNEAVFVLREPRGGIVIAAELPK